VYVDPLLASDGSTSADQVLKVSRREDEVLRRAALGQRNKEIAAGLQIAVKTVEVHKAQGMRKLGLQDRSALVRYATLQGWLQEL
jgi:DNA-binding NarL/FixJ family response regulator